MTRSRSSSRSRSRSYSPSRRSRSEKAKSPDDDKPKHTGDREDPETSNVLAVFNLSLETSENDIRDHFGPYGPIEKCRIVMDQKRNKSRGFCFITFAEEKDAITAKAKAHGSTIQEKEIRVDFSITRSAHTPTPGVYMGHKLKQEKLAKSASPASNPAPQSTRKKVTKRELSISPDRPKVRGYKSRSRSKSPSKNASAGERTKSASKSATSERPSRRRMERSRSKSRERERNRKHRRHRKRSRSRSR